MKITDTALSLLTGETRLKLAMKLGFTEQWVIRIIDANKANGPLTTAAALKVIREETGLKDSEILEETELIGEQK